MTALFIIGIYLALLLVLGYCAGRLFRGTSRDYMLASHSIGPVLLLMSLFGTTMTAFALVGSTGKSYQVGIGVYGMLASSSGIVHSACFFLIGVPLWRLGRRHGYTTQIQFFRDRLQSNRIGLLLFPILVGLIIPYLLIGVMGGGAVIAAVSHGDVPAWAGSLLICGVVLAYVFLGGMRGTAWANTFQTAVFMVLGVVTFVVIADAIGGKETFLQDLQSATQQVARKHPGKLTRESIPASVFFSYLLIPVSAGMFPHLFQHWLTARSAESFKLPIVMHPVFIMIVWLPCVLVGAWMTSATVDGTPDGTPVVAAADIATAEGKPDVNRVLAVAVSKLSGDVLGGLLSAGILAAIMSSLDSQFLCLGTMFTEDVVLHHARPGRFEDRQTVVLARAFVAGVIAVTFLLSLGNPRGVFTLGIWCFSGFTSLVPLVFAALYWKRLTKAGAYASILVAAALWGTFFWDSGLGADPTYAFGGMLPVATMFVCSTAALVLVSLLTKPPGEETLKRFFPARGGA